MITNSIRFINSLPDTRYLLFYPDIVNQLYDMINMFSDEQILFIDSIFGQLVESLEDHRKILAEIIRNSANILVSNNFPKVKLLDIKTLKNNQIPPINEKQKNNLISQSTIPFTNEQFKSLLLLLSVEQLNSLLGTLRPYQIQDLSISFSDEIKKEIIEKFSFIGVI
jgi:hypothetical protein